ncbi:MAG: glycosyltransferase family 39 protein [Anaerolineales bacterium]|nr:glycosyltransferase family 39 protein [Anaerolineales bacterium]
MEIITRHPLVSICTLYVLLALFYVWVTPPLESSDEYKHFPVVEHIATTGELVVLDPDNPGKWQQEGAQPPLYYWLTSFVIDNIDTSNLEQLHRVNHHAYIGNPNQLGNKNIMLHDPELETFPWQGSILAIYLVRFVSILLGVGTLINGYRLGELLFDKRTGYLTAAITAVNPMFLFISAAVNNDSLAAFLGSWGIYWLMWIWLEQRTADYVPGKTTPHESQLHPKLGRYVQLGVICGLAMLTKLSLAGLLLLAGIVFMWEAYRQKAPRILFVGGLTTFLIAMGMVAPWLYRNWQVYGDITGLNVFIAVQGTRENPSIFGVDWLGEFGTFYRSYWGLFGGINIAAPQWFYRLCNWLLVIGLLGWLIEPLSRAHDVESGLMRLWRQMRHSLLWPLVIWIAILFTLLVRWSIIYFSFQGRLIFPALTSINLLWVGGLLAWSRWLGGSGVMPSSVNDFLHALHFQRWPSFPSVIVIVFGTIAAVLPFSHIAPVYIYPEPVAVVRENAQFGPYRFRTAEGQLLSLVGVALEEQQTAVAGTLDGVDITLYWTLEEAAVTHNFITAVDVLGRDLTSVGRVNRYPGMGMWPTSRWEPGEIYADHYYIPIVDYAETPVRAQIRVGVLDENPEDEHDTAEMVAISPTGEQIPLVTVGAARVVAEKPLEWTPTNVVNAPMADFVTFAGYDMVDSTSADGWLDVMLYWRAEGTPSADYTVFLQLLNADFELIASGDSPPLDGDYPTSWWLAGQQIRELRGLYIPAGTPPGRYTVAVGLYNPETEARMPLLEGGDMITWEVMIE